MAESELGMTDDIQKLVSIIVSAYVSKNPVPSGELPGIIKSIHLTLQSLRTGQVSGENAQKPAVPIKKSVTPEYIISLEDGKKLKMLKRYLSTTYQLTPDQYRAKWGLPRDYPMVAPNYSVRRSDLAKKIGLGLTKARTPGKRRKR